MNSTELSDIKALIVDDEASVRKGLHEMLQKNFSWIITAGEASNIPEAVRLIHQHRPDLVFLDIEMPGYSGLQLLEFFDQKEITFDIIFVTAYNDYAIQAFKVSAFDYLLKPVSLHDLNQTLNRYRTSFQKQKISDRMELLKKSILNAEKPTRLAVSSVSGIDFIDLEQIVFFEASGSYTRIVLSSGDCVIASKPLGEFEQVLEHHTIFFRAHRSYLINLNQVQKFSTKEGEFILMKNQTEIPLSRYRKSEFDELMLKLRI
ncbi:MAG: response regulator [Cyclobacteriaceae bacterium]|nr:response regulator [Cyclobacteriaceae bacterium]MCX7636418.1 response regulator [Cyclobacteriaceae bacterium]MDW8330861.1 response regulator [Cyclobacteriaceae bacterium]